MPSPEELTTFRTYLSTCIPAEPVRAITSFERVERTSRDDEIARYLTIQQPLLDLLDRHGGEVMNGKGRKYMSLIGPVAMYEELLATPPVLNILCTLHKYQSMSINI